jgi:hypothetical protein
MASSASTAAQSTSIAMPWNESSVAPLRPDFKPAIPATAHRRSAFGRTICTRGRLSKTWPTATRSAIMRTAARHTAPLGTPTPSTASGCPTGRGNAVSATPAAYASAEPRPANERRDQQRDTSSPGGRCRRRSCQLYPTAIRNLEVRPPRRRLPARAGSGRWQALLLSLPVRLVARPRPGRHQVRAQGSRGSGRPRDRPRGEVRASREGPRLAVQRTKTTGGGTRWDPKR